MLLGNPHFGHDWYVHNCLHAYSTKSRSDPEMSMTKDVTERAEQGWKGVFQFQVVSHKRAMTWNATPIQTGGCLYTVVLVWWIVAFKTKKKAFLSLFLEREGGKETSKPSSNKPELLAVYCSPGYPCRCSAKIHCFSLDREHLMRLKGGDAQDLSCLHLTLNWRFSMCPVAIKSCPPQSCADLTLEKQSNISLNITLNFVVPKSWKITQYFLTFGNNFISQMTQL